MWDSHNEEHYMPYMFAKHYKNYMPSVLYDPFLPWKKMYKFLLHNVNDNFLRNNIHTISGFMLIIIKHNILQSNFDDFWKLWDKLFDIAMDARPSTNVDNGSWDVNHEIHNHPLAYLTLVSIIIASQNNKTAYLKLTNLIDIVDDLRSIRIIPIATIIWYRTKLDEKWISHIYQKI